MENVREYDLIESLLDKYKISEKELVSYANTNHDKIAGLESVFELQTQEDYDICVTIPFLLDPENAEGILEYFAAEKEGGPFIETAKPNVQKYSLMLIAAFNFNPAFLAMAWNWQNLIRYGIQMQAETREQDKSGIEYVFTEITVFAVNPIQHHQKASGKDSVQDIGEWPLNDSKDKNRYLGRLWIRDSYGAVQFLFQYQDYTNKPDIIKIKCRTADGSERNAVLDKIEINNEEEKELIIKSDIITDFDYSVVEILEVKFIKNA